MDLDRLTTGDKVIVGSALALLVFSFVPWFGFEHEFSRNAWHYFLFGVVPMLLALAMLLAIVARLAGRSDGLAAGARRAFLAAGCLAGVLVLCKMAIGDKVDVLAHTVELERKFGLYMSALAGLGLASAGCSSRTSRGRVARHRSRVRP